MTKWKNLAGKFTDKEIELIEKFQKKYGFKNSSHMVRASIILMIFYFGIMLELSDSKYMKTYEPKYKKLKKEISKYPIMKKQIQPFVNQLEQNLTKSLEDIADRKAKDFSSFLEKRKIGRPKATKKSRGRPKDQGI